MSKLEKHFDQLFHVFRTELTDISNTAQSEEIDLELPKGYVAKVKIVRFRSFGVSIGIGATVTTHTVQAALVRDPDDAASYEIPENEVQHDVICDYLNEVIYTINTTNGVGAIIFSNPKEYIYFSENEFDIISARNLRLVGFGTATTEMEVDVTIWYTLEKITKDEVLEILDIL